MPTEHTVTRRRNNAVLNFQSRAAQNVAATFRNRLRYANLIDTEEEWISLMLWCKWLGGGRHSVMRQKGENDWCWDQIPKEIRDMLMPIVKERVAELHARGIEEIR